LLTGCFSALSRGITEHGPVKPGAVVLDVATSPVQAPFLIVGGVMHLNQQAEIRKKTEEVLADFEKKPELLLDPDAKDRWHSTSIRRGVAEWVAKKVESPDGFSEDMLFELLRHDHKVQGDIGYVAIPPRASVALLDRLYVNYATQCLKEEFRYGDHHMPSLARSYVRQSGRTVKYYSDYEVWAAFVQLQPAKAKELRTAYAGQDERSMPDWVKELVRAMER
jgi:hypothetical protein